MAETFGRVENMKIVFVLPILFLTIFSLSDNAFAGWEYDISREQALANQQAYLDEQEQVRQDTIARGQAQSESLQEWNALHHGEPIPIQSSEPVVSTASQQVQSPANQPNVESAKVEQDVIPRYTGQNTNQVQNVAKSDYDGIYFVIGFVVSIIVAIIIAISVRASGQTSYYPIPPYRVDPPTYRRPPSIETSRRREGDTIYEEVKETKETIVGWDEDSWNLVKKKHPEHWDKFLKWVATHKEDVEAIKKNSADFKEALYKMLAKAKEDGFGEDMR